jgi:putative ABC transport system ATP-binding protein
MNTLLQMENLERHYGTPAGVVKALDGVSFEIHEGERVILLGPSGSGKTTLLNCLSALDSPTGGDYTFMSGQTQSLDAVPRNSSEKMTSFRRENIGYVFQFFNLLQDLTVLENILLIQELAGKKDPARAKELLKIVGLESEINRFPGEISGGQQQRVAIARSIAKRPTLLLGDELTGNLDTETSNKVMEALVSACKQENITSVFVTHDEGLVKYATRVIRIDSGKIVSDEQTNNDSSE